MSREQAWGELQKAKRDLSWALQSSALTGSVFGRECPDTERKDSEYLAAKRAHDAAERKWDTECANTRKEESDA